MVSGPATFHATGPLSSSCGAAVLFFSTFRKRMRSLAAVMVVDHALVALCTANSMFDWPEHR